MSDKRGSVESSNCNLDTFAFFTEQRIYLRAHEVTEY